MTSVEIALERRRFAKQWRATPAIGGIVAALFALATFAEVYRALAVARSFHIDARQALSLLQAFESPPIEGTFRGYEVAFIEHAISAAANLVTALLMVVFALGFRARIRSQTRLWQYITSLEGQVAGLDSGDTPNVQRSR